MILKSWMYSILLQWYSLVFERSLAKAVLQANPLQIAVQRCLFYCWSSQYLGCILFLRWWFLPSRCCPWTWPFNKLNRRCTWLLKTRPSLRIVIFPSPSIQRWTAPSRWSLMMAIRTSRCIRSWGTLMMLRMTYALPLFLLEAIGQQTSTNHYWFSCNSWSRLEIRRWCTFSLCTVIP